MLFSNWWKLKSANSWFDWAKTITCHIQLKYSPLYLQEGERKTQRLTKTCQESVDETAVKLQTEDIYNKLMLDWASWPYVSDMYEWEFLICSMCVRGYVQRLDPWIWMYFCLCSSSDGCVSQKHRGLPQWELTRLSGLGDSGQSKCKAELPLSFRVGVKSDIRIM